MGLLSSFFGREKREAGGDEDFSEASEGSGYGSGTGSVMNSVSYLKNITHMSGNL